MSQKRHVELRERTQQLLQGSLKHARAAALAAALVPLAAVAPSTAVAQGSWSGGAAVPSPCDFATSGGFVVTDAGKKANFGAHGGCKNGEFWGHVNFIDHSTGYHVNSVEVTGYLSPFPGSTTREICGFATTNGPEPQPVRFRVRITDNGEPGAGDEFGISLSNGYTLTSRLLNQGASGGGNVQLHDSNPSTTAPDPAPDEFVMCGGVVTP